MPTNPHTRILAVLLGAFGSAAQAQVTITTADGGGADSYVRLGQATTNFGAAGAAVVKYTGNDGSSTNRKGYLRFDISALVGVFEEASLSLTVSTSNGGSTNTTPQNFTLDLYGLNDASTAGGGFLGEDWDEAAINWENAPANIVAGAGAGDSVRTGTSTADGGEATLIGSFSVAATDIPGSVVLAAEGTALTDFLNADTNGSVTFILVRTGWSSGGGSPAPSFGGSNLAFYSKENGDGSRAPSLTATLGPAQPFEITSIENPTENAGVRITWRAVEGRTYRVVTSSDLVDWTEELTDNWPPGGAVGDSASYEDLSIPPGTRTRFYRVLEEEPAPGG